ncbi:MAG: hypothetical protein ACKOHM_12805 [Spartobacteria bacterium]
MFQAKHTLLFIRLGIVLLSFASVFHLIEHLEIAAMEKCLAHCEPSHASSESQQSDSSHTDHHHGCSAHEHSPAVLQSTLLFLPQPIVLTSPEEKMTAPPAIHRKIDHPPRLS